MSRPRTRSARTLTPCVVATFALASLLAPVHAGTILEVPGEYPTIQAALDAAQDGDEVVVAEGSYVLTSSITFPDRGITLRAASSDPGNTLLLGTELPRDSFNQMINVVGNTPGTRTIEGFTFDDGPGGIDIDVEAVDGRVRIANNHFMGNGPWRTIGARGLDVEIVDNTFAGNTSYAYAPLFIGGNATVTGNTFFDNQSIPFESILLTQGGAIYFVGINFRDALVAEVRDNDFQGNACTDYGGAINVGGWTGAVIVEGNTFTGNTADVCAGAIYQFAGTTQMTIENNVFVRNDSPQGSAIGLENIVGHVVRGNTFVGNGTGAALLLHDTDNVIVDRNLVAFNFGPGMTFVGALGTTLTCNDAYGNAGHDFPREPVAGAASPRLDAASRTAEGTLPARLAGQGNISADPLFCHLSAGDHTLAENSPCLPAGNTCGVLIGALGAGCEVQTPARTLSWGALKGRY